VRIYIESYILNIVKYDEIFHSVTAQLEMLAWKGK